VFISEITGATISESVRSVLQSMFYVPFATRGSARTTRSDQFGKFRAVGQRCVGSPGSAMFRVVHTLSKRVSVCRACAARRLFASSSAAGSSSTDDGLASAVRKGMEELSQAGACKSKAGYAARPLDQARRQKWEKSPRQLMKEEQYFDALSELFESELESE
jgi:hypothetical protein